MENPFFHRLGNILWRGIVSLLVVLAIYVSVGRLLTTNVAHWHEDILAALNARGPFVVEAQHIHGEWRSFSPILVLSGLRLGLPGSSEPPLELSEGRVTVDVLDTLRSGSLQLSRVVFVDLNLYGALSSEGKFSLQGLGSEGGEGGQQVRDFLLNVESMALRNNRLFLTLPGGEERSMSLDLTLSRDGSHRRIDARLTSTKGAAMSIIAEGVGDPFTPEHFTGQAYADLKYTDLGAIRDLMAEPILPGWADGAADIQLWFGWDRGAPSLEVRLQGSELLVAPSEQDWQLPLDRLALQAVLQRDEERWQFFVSDLQVESNGSSIVLPRVQLELGDGDLQVRAADVALEPVMNLLETLEFVPQTLRNVVTGLDPRVHLDRVSLAVDDLEQVAQSWQASANFDQLAVEPLNGAPGASSVRGFARLAPGGGAVIVDSRDVILDFPKVYRQPLQFDELHGTINIDWDQHRVRLDSGLLTTQAKEGSARVLFGLDIPRVPDDVGIQMDLMVGLRDAHPIHRAKYIPYVLKPALLDWLDSSIGDGVIHQGAFLWRGSLRKDAAPLRTVQMAFNVADTHLTYHPQWPPVLVNEGVVLINNSQVSVWAESATLFDSRVDDLSVETWLKQSQLLLAVQGSVQGPAADALTVLNDSPLASLVGKAFADWTLVGELETGLQLRMNLSDSSDKPRVQVATRWPGVDVSIEPGGLQLQKVTGEFDYSTLDGFSSRDLRGELWGRQVNAELVQRHSPGSGYDPATSTLDIALDTDIAMGDVQDWLNLELLAFARGETAVDIGIGLSPGEPPLLTIDSSLLGVSLDLPAPWKKDAGEVQPLKLAMPLGGETLPLALQFGEELRFQLDIAQGRVRGGALGIHTQPAAIEDGVLLVTGHAPLLHGDQWVQFVDQYVFGGLSPFDSAEVTGAVSPVGPDGDAPIDDELIADLESTGPEPTELELAELESPEPEPPVLAVRVDALQADSLVMFGRSVEDANVSLGVGASNLKLALDTEWVRAIHYLPWGGGTQVLDVDYLDLDNLPSFEVIDETERADADLPLMNVTLANLYQSEQRLGDLSFELSSRGEVVTVERASGELAGLRLPPERPARLTWRTGEEEFTTLQATVKFEDLGETLEHLGYQRIVETSAGQFDLDLGWPGAPAQFDLAQGQGSMEVDIDQGSFLEAPSGAQGALRVVSILNLADIVRRLSLSHMFESGIPFDSVKGEIYLHGGTLEVARMDVKGGSSFYFSGVSEIESQTLGGELVATLPVANNLPWIAALAASLPVAAGVFVVSQVFNKQVNRLSSAVYTIGGTWNEPEVDFDRVFDTRGSSASPEEDAGIEFSPVTPALPGAVQPEPP